LLTEYKKFTTQPCSSPTTATLFISTIPLCARNADITEPSRMFSSPLSLSLSHLFRVLIFEIKRYWDWSRDYPNPTLSPIFSSTSGFGSDGDLSLPSTVGWGSCITSGPFANYSVLWSNFVPSPHCLSRGFGRQPGSESFREHVEVFSKEEMAGLLSEKNFYAFTERLEGGAHDAVPNGIAGDFYTLESPNGQSLHPPTQEEKKTLMMVSRHRPRLLFTSH